MKDKLKCNHRMDSYISTVFKGIGLSAFFTYGRVKNCANDVRCWGMSLTSN